MNQNRNLKILPDRLLRLCVSFYWTRIEIRVTEKITRAVYIIYIYISITCWVKHAARIMWPLVKISPIDRRSMILLQIFSCNFFVQHTLFLSCTSAVWGVILAPTTALQTTKKWLYTAFSAIYSHSWKIAGAGFEPTTFGLWELWSFVFYCKNIAL